MLGPQDGVPAASGAPAPGVGADHVELLLTSLVTLALVCAVAWIAVRCLRAWLGARPSGGVTVVARIPLEPRRSLFILDAAGRRLLVGSSEGGITLLTELPPEAATPSPAPRSRFAELLHAARSRRAARHPAPAAATSSDASRDAA